MRTSPVTGRGPAAGAELGFALPGQPPFAARVESLTFVGYGGRDRNAVDAHIAEMSRLGIAPPKSTPCFYPVAPHLLTQAPLLKVYGPDTGPELEFVLFQHEGQRYVTVGNDQTDLEVERLVSAEKAKNCCPKAIASEAWLLGDVVDIWDRLRLRLVANGRTVQDGGVDELLRPEILFDLVSSRLGASAAAAMIFSGTIGMRESCPALPCDMTMSLEDPVMGRVLRHAFRIEMLPQPVQ